MKIAASISLIVFAAALLAFSATAAYVAPPTSLSGRGLFILAMAAAGLVLGGMAIKELHVIRLRNRRVGA